MTPQTKEILLGQLRTWGSGVGLAIAGSAATHGIISGTSAASIGAIVGGCIVSTVCAAYSWWDKTGRDTVGAIFTAQLETLKAYSQAQARKMAERNVPPVTVKEIAAASAASPTTTTMTPVEVSKTLATLPTEISSNVVGKTVIAAVVALIAVLGCAPGAHAQTKLPIKAPDLSSLGGAIQQFAVDDVQGAQQSAIDSGDKPGEMCWTALLPVVKQKFAIVPKKPGVAGAIQAARNLRRLAFSTLSPDVCNACAPLTLDPLVGNPLRAVLNLGCKQ